jgi:predicted acyl esterase
MEDPFAMLDKYPLVNAYWEDKRADVSRITVPSYTLASYSTMLHTYGSVRGYREMSCQNKW